MLSKLKTTISRNLTNAKGWRTNRKIVVFESDDWGSIRMPNSDVQNKFQNLGYNIEDDPYCKFDTLANTDDLTGLFEILQSTKDRNDRNPVFTFNTVVSNPDFNRIKESKYTEYSYVPFIETLNEYYPNQNVFTIWIEGLEKGLIKPQFHGREHVNAPIWLNELSKGNKIFLDAFEMSFWGIPKKLYNNNIPNIQATYGSAENEFKYFYEDSIIKGLELFEDIFRFRSASFIPNNYTWLPELNSLLKENGINVFQGMKYQMIPKLKSSKKLLPVYTGKSNKYGQKYTVRNCMFEPSQTSENCDDLKNCLKQINQAFFFKKPAIITTHRLNYISSLDSKNRGNNLKSLKNLLNEITRRWPDVEFMSSDELALLI